VPKLARPEKGHRAEGGGHCFEIKEARWVCLARKTLQWNRKRPSGGGQSEISKVELKRRFAMGKIKISNPGETTNETKDIRRRLGAKIERYMKKVTIKSRTQDEYFPKKGIPNVEGVPFSSLG